MYDIYNMINLSYGLSTLLKILIISIGAYIIIKILYKIVGRIEKKINLDMTVVYVLNDCFKYFILVIAFAWILELIGIDIRGIIVSLGIIGIGLGIASKDIVSNFLSGLFILSDKTIRIGDVISIDNEKGTVQKIGLRNTTIINQDKHIITIPNSLLNSKHYKKFSPFEDYRIDVLVTIPHNIKLDKFKENVLEIMNKYEWISEEKLPSIKGDSLTEYGPKIKISAWTKNYNMLDSGKLIIINDINQLIYNKYLEN